MVCLQVVRENPRAHARPRVGVPQDGPDRRGDEQLETDERAAGVPGQTEDEFAAEGAEEQRLPGLHADFVEVDVDAERSEHFRDEVVIADGDAAGEEEDIGRIEGGSDRTPQFRFRIRADTVVGGNATEPCGLREQHRPVGIADLPVHGALRRTDEFVPGGQHADARSRVQKQFRPADPRE